jgi:spore coat protein CotH
MKLKLLRTLLWLLPLCGIQGYAQVSFTDSNLPIFIIDTDIDPETGQPMEIPDDPKIWADLKIIYHEDGSRNYLTDQDNPEFLNYDGRIKIELRGSSSQWLEKKQYGWTTYDDAEEKQNVSLLGMPSENDWILNGLAYDPSLMRDYLCYNLARQMGQYATRTHYCEVIINGDYRGLYILQEKIKDDSKRVNIEEIDEDATEGMPLTGGYITKADKTTGGDPVAWYMDSYAAGTPVSEFIHELPKPEDITPEQNEYIHGVFLDLETTASTGNTNPATGYTSVIDIPTFVDFMVLNEFSSNVDAYQISTFFHKDKGGKLRAGPVWDFNLSIGLDVFGDRSHTDVWQFGNDDNEGPKFWTDLFNNTEFKCYFARRWNEVTATGQPLNYDSLTNFIDETYALINEAGTREQERWGTVPNLQGELDFMKSWIAERLTWVSANAGSFDACANPQLPQLVITAINYNPDESAEFPESDDQEFIEIKNTGTTTTDLTGVYLRELGISYQFPSGSTIAAGAVLRLASNPEVFEARYGTPAFGSFERNLSNSTQPLVLADAFGNIIDAVTYDDDTPWPDADGSGMYLQLTDVSLDNSLPSSWVATNATLSGNNFGSIANVAFYPNPTGNILNVSAAQNVTGIEIVDIYGKLLQKIKADNITQINLGQYANGIYFIRAFAANGSVTQKIVKQ